MVQILFFFGGGVPGLAIGLPGVPDLAIAKKKTSYVRTFKLLQAETYFEVIINNEAVFCL